MKSNSDIRTHVKMEDSMTKMNMFSSDQSNDFTDGTDAGEPLIVVVCNKCNKL